jgi:serine phosphatase RsbU (regulator of sigma subunit)
MTGFPRQDLIGSDLSRFYSPEEWDFLRQQMEAAFRDGHNRYTFVLPLKNGGRLPVISSSQTIQDSCGLFRIVTFTDISEQVQSEEELRSANEKLRERQMEIEEDLRLAASIQRSLTPNSLVCGAITVDAYYHPAHSIGGDFALVTPFEEEHLNLLVCDVSGHGISSALVANRIYSEVRTMLGNRAPLANMLRQLNSLVVRNVGVPGVFFTLAAARVDRSGKRMEFAGAGHPPAMIVQPGAEPRLLPSRSMILGTMPDAVNADATLHAELEPGDRIVLYTDGITDVFDSRGEMLEVEGIQNFVRETALLPFSEMKQGILNLVAGWRDGPPVDDMSLVLAEVH